MKLVIDISALDRTNSAVTSTTDTTPAKGVQTLILGDAEPLDITFTDSSQSPAAAPSWAGASGYSLVVGLGTLDANALLCHTATSSFVPKTGGWTGAIALNTDQLVKAVLISTTAGLSGWALVATDPRSRNARPVQTWFWLQVQVVDPSGSPVSYALIRVQVLNHTLPKSVVPTTSPTDAFYAWLFANVVLNAGSVTALIGGSANCLDGYDDALLPTGCVIQLSYGNALQNWKLEASTATTDITATPARVRAKGYAGSNRVWFQTG